MPKFKTDAENFQEMLEYARTLTAYQIRMELRNRSAFHDWAIRALEQALAEKEAVEPGRGESR